MYGAPAVLPPMYRAPAVLPYRQPGSSRRWRTGRATPIPPEFPVLYPDVRYRQPAPGLAVSFFMWAAPNCCATRSHRQALTQGRRDPHGGMMLGGTLSFLGPSTLLSTTFRASSNAWVGVGMGGVLASRKPSSSWIVTIKPACRVRARPRE